MKHYLRRPYFNNGDSFQSEAKEDGYPFINDSLFADEKHQAICEYRQVTAEKMMKKTIQTMGELHSRYEKVFDTMDVPIRRRANAMLVQFQQAMSQKRRTGEVFYSVDCYTDESLIIRFSQRKDVRLTINFTEPEYINEHRNIEEAYLSYVKGKTRVIKNSTLENIIMELDKLI